MKKILITGPESTGKSVLARQLAAHYQTAWVPEYARTYLEKLGRPYTEEDLLHIARGQLQLEDFQAQFARTVLPCDTGMLVMKVWSEFKYGRCAPWIIEQLYKRHYSLVLLCGIDTPWEYDPLREHPRQREALFAIYKRELQRLGLPYVELWGGKEERLEKAIALL